jgi:hypothetical protein
MLASLADAVARDSKTKSAATAAWVARLHRGKYLRTLDEKQIIFYSIINYVNP